MNSTAQSYPRRLNARACVMTMLLLTSLFWLAGCDHTVALTREMTWSIESSAVGLRDLPEGGVRLTFVQTPKFHVGLRLPGLKEHLEQARKKEISVRFEIQCKHCQFAMIRVRSVDGISFQSGPTNMWMESASVVPGQDSGPFHGACRY
jgi:hypothetical protein